MTRKRITFDSLLTNSELTKAERIYKHDRDHFIDRTAREIIEPVIDRINFQLNQENDPMFIAYGLMYAIRNITE
jgi:hypothetical protein